MPKSFSFRAILFLSVFYAYSTGARAETLDAISVSESASDVAQDDPVVRPRDYHSDPHHTNGSVLQSLVRDSAVPVAQSGGAGSLSQIVGAGSSSLDTGVQAMGIPLNAIQGGGFDFSIFPSYLWSSLSLRLGSQLGVLDPRATAGTIALVPWTLDVLDEREPLTRLSLSASTLEFGQASAGVHPRKGTAILGGFGVGSLRGPSGSLAQRIELGSRTVLTFQSLATRIETDPKGSDMFPTPHAFQRTTRWIPTLAVEHSWAPDARLIFQPFYDVQRISYSDDDRSIARTQSFAQQQGVESTFQYSKITVNAGTRALRFRSSDFRAPHESQSHVQVSVAKTLGPFTLNPAAGWVWVTSTESSPNVSLGASAKPVDSFLIYSRASWMRRYGTLFDRYYTTTGVQANPSLLPEIQRALLVGTDWKGASLDIRFESFNRVRTRTQESVLRSGDYRKENVGHSFSTYNELMADYRLATRISLKGAVSFSQSSFSRRIQNVGSLIVRSSEASRSTWKGRLGIRQSAPVRNRLTGDLPAFWALDTDFDYGISERLQLLFRVENWNQSHIETVKGYSQPGRVSSLALQATL